MARIERLISGFFGPFGRRLRAVAAARKEREAAAEFRVEDDNRSLRRENRELQNIIQELKSRPTTAPVMSQRLLGPQCFNSDHTKMGVENLQLKTRLQLVGLMLVNVEKLWKEGDRFSAERMMFDARRSCDTGVRPTPGRTPAPPSPESTQPKQSVDEYYEAQRQAISFDDQVKPPMPSTRRTM